MIIYEVEIEVEEEIKADYGQWLKSDHIPEVLLSQGFVRACVVSEAQTFRVQLFRPILLFIWKNICKSGLLAFGASANSSGDLK